MKPVPIRGLTIRPPWAELIASGSKTIETRTWKTNFRGRIAIHESKVGRKPGRVIATAILSDVRAMTPEDEAAACCPYIPGRFAWVLTDVRRVRPIVMKGALGLWNFPEALLEADLERIRNQGADGDVVA